MIPKTIISTPMNSTETKKSVMVETEVDSGTNMRGKKTFDTRSRLETREVAAREMIPLNRFQARRPAKAKAR